MRRVVLFLALIPLLASQTYVPPPPPKLPAMLSEKMVEMGRGLFEENTLRDSPLEVFNYLGNQPCSACHDKVQKLKPQSVAGKFKDIRDIINSEISKRSKGVELSREDPALEALVQYLIKKYKLYEYKLVK